MFSTKINFIKTVILLGLLSIAFNVHSAKKSKKKSKKAKCPDAFVKTEPSEGSLTLSNKVLSPVDIDTIRKSEDFSKVKLKLVHGNNIDLSELNAIGLTLMEALLSNINLENSNISEGNMQGSIFSLGNLRGTRLVGADLRGINLKGADLAGADFTEANLEPIPESSTKRTKKNSNLEEIQAEGAVFISANVKGVSFEGAVLTNTNFENANIEEALFINADIRGANFSSAKKLHTADFNGAIYNDQTQLPDFLKSKRERKLRGLVFKAE